MRWPIRARRFIGSTLFSIGMIAATVVWAPVVLTTAPLNLRTRSFVATRWVVFVLWWLKVTCGIAHTVRGLEHVPERPCVILSKHQSTFETLLLPLLFQPLAVVLKRELLWVPFFGWALALVNPVPIDRSSGKSAMRQVIERGTAHLADGQWVLLFPEGTRTAPGTRRRYKPGGAVLAVEAGCLVLPIAHNAGQFWGRKQFLKRPGTVQVVVGQPIETRGRHSQKVMDEVEAWIEQTVAEISGVPVPAPPARSGRDRV